ncbi:hypothetical protein [Streptomyces hydrogenans]|uniref:hypothetical protein n=1 Tax=Streptomyces hydrogenans TaxID=1873719 RepID=UPI0038259DF4
MSAISTVEVAKAKKELDAALKAVDKAKGAVYQYVADALPEAPPAGGRLDREDRKVQNELIDSTGWSRPHLRRVQQQVRQAREADGKAARRHSTTAARKALTPDSNALKALRTAQDDEVTARARLADAVLAVAPHTQPVEGTNRKALFAELMRITGYTERTLDIMRREAADRQQAEADRERAEREAGFLADDAKGRKAELRRAAAEKTAGGMRPAECDPGCDPGTLCLFDAEECAAEAAP